MRRLWMPASLAVLAGCAAPAPPPAAPAVSVSHATIVAVRPVAPAADVLAMLGAPLGEGDARREFILRTADGRILSVVQEDDGALRPGQPVSLVGDGRARLLAAE